VVFVHFCGSFAFGIAGNGFLFGPLSQELIFSGGFVSWSIASPRAKI
jgi:hypothetical protein